MQTARTRRFAAMAAAAFSLLALVATAGCDAIERELQRRCQSAETTYQQELADEQTELADGADLPEDDQRPAHFGITLSNDLLSDLADTAIEPVLKGLLGFVETVEVDGKSIDLQTSGEILDLSLEAHEACEHCFEVGIDLGGRLTADIPGVGTETAGLDGAAELVVPLMLTRGEDKSTAVKLDLAQFVDIGESRFIPRINDISRDWENKLRLPLGDVIRQILARNLEPVTLVEFDGPSFGIEGFELAPVELKSDAANGSVFAGFATNIAGLNTESVAGVESVTALGEGQNIALSFQPQMIVRVLSLLIGVDEIARRYTRDGEAAEEGNFHVTLETFTAGETVRPPAGDAGMSTAGMSADVASGDVGVDAGDAAGTGAGETGLPVGLDFQMHNFDENGFCFSAGARMFGGIGVRDGDLEIGIRDVQFTSDSVPQGLVDIANWTSAQFIEESRALVDESLDGEHLTVPGTSLSVGPVDVGLRPNTVLLRGSSSTGGRF